MDDTGGDDVFFKIKRNRVAMSHILDIDQGE